MVNNEWIEFYLQALSKSNLWLYQPTKWPQNELDLLDILLFVKTPCIETKKKVKLHSNYSSSVQIIQGVEKLDTSTEEQCCDPLLPPFIGARILALST